MWRGKELETDFLIAEREGLPVHGSHGAGTRRTGTCDFSVQSSHEREYSKRYKHGEHSQFLKKGLICIEACSESDAVDGPSSSRRRKVFIEAERVFGGR